jgi:hypothetical protein
VAALTALGGSDDNEFTLTTREASVAASATAEKATEVRTTERAMVAKATEEATAMKVAMDEVAVTKVAEEAMAKMVAEEATVKTVMDEAAVKTTDQGAAGAKAAVESVGFGSSPSPMTGTKRAAAPGSSTPPSIQLRCAWKPQYVEQHLSRFFLFISIRL